MKKQTGLRFSPPISRMLCLAAGFLSLAFPAMAVFSLSNITLSTTTIVSGDSLTLDFTYSSDTSGRQIGYFIAYSKQCTLTAAGTGQDIIVGDAGVNVLAPGGQVNGGRQVVCGTQCNAATNYQISGIEGGQLTLTIPPDYPTGTYYIIVAVKDWNIYLNPSVSVDAQMCKSISVTAPTPTVTRTLTPTPTGIQNVGRSPFGLTNYVAYIMSNASPSRTPTYTVTNTRTPTSTFTSTRTPTPTSTNTVSPTPTFTVTPTPTFTFTHTPTSTFTATQSATASMSPSGTYTITWTPTATSTRTPSPTFTCTRTFTPTVTPTPTSTMTDTISSNTPTYTPTYTVTPTFTFTFSNTATPSATASVTPSGTYTITWTPTSTKTCTPSATASMSPSGTYTITWTFTFTETISSNTPTNTPSPSDTFTFTPTYTCTSTYTDTPTGTPTFTNTPSLTLTITSSPVNTATFTPTATLTFTVTDTVTYSATPTCTYTVTVTPTFTQTSTETFTFSATPSFTRTPSISPTVMPFPYILSVEAYNEAGEKVRTIGVIQLSSGINGMQMEEGGKITDLFNPADGSLSIIFPGIDSPGSSGGVTLDWDAKNDSGMDVNQGVYYIKAEVRDNYGHVNTLIEQITILKTEEWARISIYNEAGEIVARLQDNVVPAEPIELELDNVILVGGGAAPAAFKYSASGTLYWDGKNSFGDLVSSGIYEIQLEVKTKNGCSTVVESKTVTVLAAQPGKILGDVKVYPNPCVFQDEPAAPVTINWTNKNKGEVTIRIYNIAGELIKTIRAGLDSLPGANWDLTSSNGKYTTSGLYVIVIHARSAAGQQETKKIKFAVIQKYIYNNDLVN